MVNILSHIVEFRNGESGQHVRHIHMMTEILLQHLQKRITKYQITQEDIVRIATASAFHDIGKISIPDTILNKPGKLTKEEYEIVKTHSMAGSLFLPRSFLLQMYMMLLPVSDVIKSLFHMKRQWR